MDTVRADEELVSFNNASRTKVLLLLALIALAGVILAGVLGSRSMLSEVRDLILTGIAFLILLQFLGELSFVPYVDIRKDGVAYGKRLFVPWSAVARFEWQRPRLARRSSLWMVIRESDAPSFKRLLRRGPIPLTAFAPHREGEWMLALKRLAPSELTQGLQR